MRQSNSRHAVLSETVTFDEETGDLRIVIETPKGSRNKYKYVPSCDCLELATALPEGMVFPYDFGFCLRPSVRTAIPWTCWFSWTPRWCRAA